MTDPWRDIATAPPPALKPLKLDIWVEDSGGDGYRVTDAWRHDGGWRIKSRWMGDRDAVPWTHTATHWMLPPPPPEAA